ncbi:MAG TPA: hypothetical protein PKC65_09650 [Pyrinomonadaceae bacterium]|mgnify:CR=1 FL=1|nr:hypothetical protein [Pyrinomonadaceae bacterium]
MNLRTEILREYSRRQMLKVVGHVGGDKERFAELMRLFLSGEYRVVQRSAWAVSKVVERAPKLIAPYFRSLVAMLEDDSAHPAAHRNILRLLQTAPIPARYEGRLYDLCITKIDDPTAPTAVRAFAIEVAARIARGEPDLLAEITLVTGRHLKDAKAAIKAKARNVLKVGAEK